MGTEVVKWFNPLKGYGFAVPVGGGDGRFFNISEIEGKRILRPQVGQTIHLSDVGGSRVWRQSTDGMEEDADHDYRQERDEIYQLLRECRAKVQAWREVNNGSSASLQNAAGREKLLDVIAQAFLFSKQYRRNTQIFDRMLKERGIEPVASHANPFAPMIKLVFGDFVRAEAEARQGETIRWQIDDQALEIAQILRWLDSSGCSPSEAVERIQSAGGIKRVIDLDKADHRKG